MSSQPKHKTLLPVAFVAIAAVGIAAVLIRNVSNNTEVSTEGIRETVAEFDSLAKLPGTGVSFKYPSAGFYDKGIRLFTKPRGSSPGLISGITTNPTAPFDPSSGEEFLTLSVDLQESSASDLETVIAAFSEGSLDKLYASTGNYENYAGHRFYVYVIKEGVTTFRALSKSSDGLVSVTLAYKPSEAGSEDTWLDANRKLLDATLSKIEFN